MLQIEVALEVPLRIAQGLASGQLERVGGVVRDVGSKQVVMWLREGARITDNSNLTSGVLRSLLDVGSGSLTGVAFGALDTVVAANRHYQIMQQFSALTNLVGVVGGIGVVNIAVSAVSMAVILKRFSDIERQLEGLYKELQSNQNAYLQAGLDAAQDAATAAEAGDIENKRSYALQAIDRLRQAHGPLLDKVRDLELTGDNDLLLAHLSQAMQVDAVHIRCYLENNDLPNAKRHLCQALGVYREMTRTAVHRLLGSSRAIYFHPTVSDEDLWRYVGIRKWLSDRDVELSFLLQEILLADRHDFWNPDIVKDIDASAKRLSIRQRLSPKNSSSFESLPPHLLALAKADVLIENYRRLEGIEAEVEAIERLRVSVPEWESHIAERLADKDVVVAEHDDYVLLVDKDWLAEQSDSTAA
ncbi:MAG: hypothetical protein OXN94_05835 [Chloroflexota bacterium]|nr:hypothetical protein [Chloroflexota bacterium]MDE2951507.1 hypothetical protein [Chloroflexota bacterium]